jgi:hypothetical protein
MAITRGFGITFDVESGAVKPWAFRAAKGDDGKTRWLADQLCPVCGSNCSTNGRVTQCLNDKCGWDNAGRKHGSR